MRRGQCGALNCPPSANPHPTRLPRQDVTAAYLDTDAAVQAWAQRVSKAKRLALDTEGASFHRFPKLDCFRDVRTDFDIDVFACHASQLCAIMMGGSS